MQVITTPAGHVVELKESITFGESRKIERVYMQGMKVTSTSKDPSIDGSVVAEAQDEAAKVYLNKVTLVSGEVITEPSKMFEAVQHFSPADGKVIYDAIDALRAPAPKAQS